MLTIRFLLCCSSACEIAKTPKRSSKYMCLILSMVKATVNELWVEFGSNKRTGKEARDDNWLDHFLHSNGFRENI